MLAGKCLGDSNIILKFIEVRLAEVVFGFEGACNLENEQARAVVRFAVSDDYVGAENLADVVGPGNPPLTSLRLTRGLRSTSSGLEHP